MNDDVPGEQREDRLENMRQRIAHLEAMQARLEEELQSLKESEARYEAAMRGFEGLIYVCSPNGEIEFMNEPMVRRAGRNRVGEKCHMAIQGLEHSCLMAVENESPPCETVRREVLNPEDGLWYDVVTTPLVHVDGSVSTVVIAQDITDRKRAEDALRDSETRFRSVAQSAVDAIISIDGSDTIVSWNKGAQDIFGYSEEEIVGKPILTIVPERYRKAHREGVERYMRTNEPVLIGKTAELQGLKKGDVEFPIELSLSTWKAKGETFFTGIIRDISDRKEAEKALERRTEEANRRSGELESLVQMVAHDLKSPVMTIGGLVRLLKNTLNTVPPDSRRDEILGQVTSAALTMEHFLKDLLDGLAVEHTKPELTPMRLEETIQEVIGQHKQELQERGIDVQMEAPPATPVVYGDKRRIRQVVENILTNAIRHMGNNPDPRITIAVVENDDDVVIRISDNGVGIPREYHSRIFDRFFRVPRAGESRGTGLGLAIVKKIVQTHNGKIWVESEEGKGATFCFTLPRRSVQTPRTERK